MASINSLARLGFLVSVGLVGCVPYGHESGGRPAAPGKVDDSTDAEATPGESACADPEGTFAGDLELLTGEDLRAAAKYRCVRGGVFFDAFDRLGLYEIELPNLTWVGGGVSISGGVDFERLSLPSLRYVGGRVNPGSRSYPTTKLKSVSLPALEKTKGVEMTGNAGLIEADFSSLVEVADSFRASVNPKLSILRLSLLRKAEFVEFAGNPSLPQCAIDAVFARLVAAGIDAWRLTARDLDPDASCY